MRIVPLALLGLLFGGVAFAQYGGGDQQGNPAAVDVPNLNEPRKNLNQPGQLKQPDQLNQEQGATPRAPQPTPYTTPAAPDMGTPPGTQQPITP